MFQNIPQKTINIVIGIAVVVVIVGLSALAISYNSRLAYLEGKVS